MSNDWRDGFLFVGNDLALDFLNTRPVMNGQPVEMLRDGDAVARWLAAAGLTTHRQSSGLKRRWSAPEFAPVLEEIRKLREDLRSAVFQIEAGHRPSTGFIKHLNELLLRHPYPDEVIQGDAGLERRKSFAPENPEDILAPL